MGNVSTFYFTHTSTIQRPTPTKGRSGGAKRVWAAVTDLTDLPTAVQPSSAYDINLFASRNLQITHSLYIESDPAIRKGDRLLLSDGRIFSVRGAINYASFDTLWKVFCRELSS